MIQGPAPRISESIVAKALPLPKVGSLLGGKKVTKVRVQDTDPHYYVVGINLEKGAKRKDVEAGLMELLNVHIINSKEAGDLVVSKKHFEMVPTRTGPVVYIAMHIVPIIRSNPGKVLSPLEDFNQHYTKMVELNPKKWFRQFPLRNPHGPAHRDRLWKFVGYMGESYGYCDKNSIYHRRASTIMPKIKITKAVEGCDTFYHTHPSKDEPSLTSPDDYLLYFDLSYEPRSIRNFYTIMKDRIDHFKITPKKDSLGNYVRIGEDNFIDEVDAKIDELMEKYTDSFPMDKMGGLKFCEKVTRETVKWLNKKYSKYVTVKYNCYFRVRQNPPEPEYTDLHLGDTFLAKAIADVQSGEYSWPTSDMDKKPQEGYAYWFGQYYFMEEDHSRQTALLAAVGTDREVATAPRERSKHLGLLPARLQAINHYLDQKVKEDYTNYDIMNLLNLHIDIMRTDSKITDGGGVKSRIEDMAEAMGIPDEVKDDLLVIEEARLLGPYTDEAKTLAGDYYIVLLLVDLCLRAVEIMDEVKAGTKDANYARFEVYNKLKQQAISNIDVELDKHMKAFNQGKKSLRINPATTLKKSEYSAFIPPQYLSVGGIVTEALEEFAPYEAGKPFITGKSKLNMRVPGGGTLVSVQLSSLNTGNLQFFVPAKGHPVPEDSDKAAMEAYQKIVNRLNEYGLNIPTEEQEVGSTTVSNPRKDTQLILIAGPSGAGKSTTIRNLLKSLPNSKTVPTYTTRPKRKSDKKGEKRFVTKEQFKAMEAAGEFAESALQKNGNHYGRRREDFMGADYVVVDATLSGVNRLAKMFPNAYTVYLEPQESPEFIRQRLIRRGDMSPQEARGRSSLIPSHIRSSKMMSFDKRIITKQGHFNDIAIEILDSIPRNNPVIPFRIPPEAAPELDKRLTAMMRAPGYKPQTIKEAIAEGIYDEQPSDFSYAQGEYDEFLEEIEKGDMDEAFAEYSDVEGHVAYWLYTNHGIEVPIYNTIHLDKTRERVKVFDNIFTDFGLEFDSKYLKGGSNFQKTTKVRLALETAAKDQGKPFTATDNEIRDAIAKAVPNVVMENPSAGMLVYDRSSRDKRSRLQKLKDTVRGRNRKQDKFIGHAARPELGVTLETRMREKKRFRRQKPMTFEEDLFEDWRYEVPGSYTSAGTAYAKVGEDGETIARGVRLKPKAINDDAGKLMFKAMDNSPDLEGHKYRDEIEKAIFLAYSTYEPLVDKNGEYLSLRHRDADKIREAFYLLRHQKVTDHEFAHIADAGNEGYEFAGEDPKYGRKSGSKFNRGAETIAEVISSPMYMAVAPLEDLRVILVPWTKTIIEYADEKKFQPKLMETYGRNVAGMKIVEVREGETMAEAEGRVRLEILGQDPGPTLVNPPERRREPVTLEQFTRWVQLVNMKNKELKRFLDSSLGKEAGINKEKQKKFGGINRGRTSGLAILRMRARLGLTGPKDYIKNGPMIIKRYYEMALEKWNETDWYWCSRQISFNSRARGQRGPYTDKKGRPTRKLLALWVWGHDPWRYARKIEKREDMPPCPNVPWIGMTEKRKWGTTEFVFRNPAKEKYLDGEAQTLVFIKPRGLNSWLEIKRMLPGPVLKKRWVRVDRDLISSHYAEHSGKPHFNRLVDYYEGQWVLALIVGAKFDAVRAIIGSSKPDQLNEGDIRKVILDKYGGSSYSLLEDWTSGVDNGIHASDSVDAANRELRLWFDSPIDPTPKFLNMSSHPVEESNDDNFHPFAGLTVPVDDWNKCAELVVDFYEAMPWLPGWIRGREPPVLLVGGVTVLVILNIYVFKAIVGKDPIVQGGNPFSEEDPLPESQRLHLNKLIEDLRRRRPALVNPGRIPKKYEGQDPSEHSDLFTDEDPVNTIQGLGFKDKETAEKSINIIKRSGKTHAHKMQAAMAMEQRARFHAHQTPGIRAGQKVYAKFIEEMKEKTKAMRNPRTPKGKKFPTKYLKGLTPLEKEIAIKEIDDGYEYDLDDPEAYKYWESDIKATARGYKTVPSKYQKKFVKMYGPLPDKGDFLTKVSKATKIKKSILQKVYDKGLAAWRVGHRPGVQQHQWAAGRVYSFVTLGNTVMKSGKKMPDYSLAVEAGLIKSNPGVAYRQVEPEAFVKVRNQANRLPFLHVYDANYMRTNNIRGYLSTDNMTGYSLSSSGDLQNVFNIGPRGQGKTAVRDAIARGARTVDAFDPFLPRYYAQFGFQEYDRVKWNDEYAPAGWPYATYGRPDVVFMSIDGERPNPHIGSKKYEKEWRHGKFAEDDPFAEMFDS